MSCLLILNKQIIMQTLDLVLISNITIQHLANPNNQQLRLQYMQAVSIITDPQHLPAILDSLSLSQQFMLSVLTELHKCIRQGSYLPQIKSLQQQSNRCCDQAERTGIKQKISNIKVDVYWGIIDKLYKIIQFGTLPVYLVNSAKDLIAACLKAMIENADDNQFLAGFITMFFPQFVKSAEPTTPQQHNTFRINVPQNFIFQDSYPFAIKTLISFLEIISHDYNYKSYYDFRFYVNNFRYPHMPIILQVVIFHLKGLFWLAKQCQIQTIFQHILLTVQLLTAVLEFPYTVNVSEFDHNMDTNTSSDIIFPVFFKKLHFDGALIQDFYNLLFYYLETVKDLASAIQVLNLLTKINSASTYFMDHIQQRRDFKDMAIKNCMRIMRSSQNFDQTYCNALIQLLEKIVNKLSKKEDQIFFCQFVDQILSYSLCVVTHSAIFTDIQDTSNSINKVFELIKKIYSDIKPESDPKWSMDVFQQANGLNYDISQFRQKCQFLLETYWRRLCTPSQIQPLVKAQFRNYKQQIRIYKQLFSNSHFLFQLNLTNNLSILSQSIEKNNITQKPMLYFCICFLHDHNNFGQEQTELLLNLFKYVKNTMSTMSICCIYVLEVMVTNVLCELKDSISQSKLWYYISKSKNGVEYFHQFMTFVIKIFVGNLEIEDVNIIEYSMDVLKFIYDKLKRHHEQPEQKRYTNNTFEQYYQLFRKLLQNIDKTSFCKPQFYPQRIRFFQIVSILWIQNSSSIFWYQIYGNLRLQIMNPTITTDAVIKYMCDVTGIISSITSCQSYQVFAELILQDLPHAFSKIDSQQLLTDKIGIKTIIKMCYYLTDNESQRITMKQHGTIGIQIYSVLKNVAEMLGTINCSKKLLKVFERLPNYNRLEWLCTLPNKKLLKKRQAEETLWKKILDIYFQNIQRYRNIGELYHHIGENVEHMYMWWEEALNRGIQIEIENFSQIVKAKLWKNRREQNHMATLAFWAVNYNPKYRVFPQLAAFESREQVFIKGFLEVNK